MADAKIKAGQEPKVLLMLGIQQSLFLAGGIGIWIMSGRELASFIQFGWPDLLIGLLLTAALVGLHRLTFMLWPAGSKRLAREMGQTVFSTARPWSFGGILLLSFSAGIGEEALFRAGLQTLAGDYMPAWAAILAATLLFTLMHPGSRAYMACVALISVLFGAAYHWSGSLLAVMIAHALFDVYACLWTQRELRRLGHWSGAPAALASKQQTAPDPGSNLVM